LSFKTRVSKESERSQEVNPEIWDPAKVTVQILPEIVPSPTELTSLDPKKSLVKIP
jgi:hypothetical protein